MANLTLKNNSGGITSITADEFLGTSSFTKLLQLYDASNGSSTGISSWTPNSEIIPVFKQYWKNNNLNDDTGDLVLYLRNNENNSTELCMVIDGDYYSMGVKVLNERNYISYALPLAGGTMTGDIFSANIYPKTTMTYNIGSQTNELNALFTRQLFVRHIEPASNVDNDLYINYNNRGGCIRIYTNLNMSGIGSITNLPINGGILWNPYVESDLDNSDLSGILLYSAGANNGTELRLFVENDYTDIINLVAPQWIFLNSKSAFRIDDSWLRINEAGGFSSGVYFGPSVVRTDNQLQVGESGSAFIARIDGYGRFSYKLDIGAHVSLWADNEGGNIQLHSGNEHTNTWEIDSYNGNLRFFTYRESDGAFQSNYFDQNNGYIGNAYWASQAGTLAQAGNSSYPMTFYWSGQSGQPNWVWGGNDGTNMYVYNPSNFNVNSSAYIRASIGNYNAGGLYYGNSNDSIDGSGSWTNWIQFGTSGDWHSRLSFPYWSYPRYTRYYADSGSYSSWHIFHTSESVYVQSATPTGAFIGQIWLKI